MGGVDADNFLAHTQDMTNGKTILFLIISGLGIAAATAQTETHSEIKLLQLAKEKFTNNLTQGEETLFRSVTNGKQIEHVDSFGNNWTDLENSTNWPDEFVIRSSRISWLCTDQEAISLVTRCIQVCGYRIDGDLDLSLANISFPLIFKQCVFRGDLIFFNSHLEGLYLDGSHIKNLLADGLFVDQGVYFRNGFIAEGKVSLGNSFIGSNLDCQGGQFSNSNGIAIMAQGSKIQGSVFMRYGFKADGEVNLASTKIAGDLDCRDAQFINIKGVALNVDGARIEQKVCLKGNFRAEGEVLFTGAIIDGSLECSGGQFINSGGVALWVDSAKIGGSVFFHNGFNAEGAVVLGDTVIGKDLVCGAGRFSNKNSRMGALCAQRAKIEGGVFIDEKFSADGILDFENTTIGSSFIMEDVVSPENIKLSLNSAKIQTLVDNIRSWPGSIFLDNFVYDEIDARAPTDSESRVKWLHLQPTNEFFPQPVRATRFGFTQNGT